MPHPTFGEEDKIHGVTPAMPQTFEEKVKNFWYHYKWHSIFAAFLAIVLLVVSLQMCSKESYDIYVMYAGPRAFSSQEVGFTAVEMEKLCPDFDGDGKANVSFANLYIVESEDVKDLPDPGGLIMQSKKNYDSFQSEVMTGTYKLCLLDYALYTELSTAGALSDLSLVTTGIPEDKLLGEGKTGVYLRDLAIYQNAAFSVLPGDTVVCLRRASAVVQWYHSVMPWTRDDSEKEVAEHAAALQAWIDYTPAE